MASVFSLCPNPENPELPKVLINYGSRFSNSQFSKSTSWNLSNKASIYGSLPEDYFWIEKWTNLFSVVFFLVQRVLLFSTYLFKLLCLHICWLDFINPGLNRQLPTYERLIDWKNFLPLESSHEIKYQCRFMPIFSALFGYFRQKEEHR